MLFEEDEYTQSPQVKEQTLRDILQEQFGITGGTYNKLTGYEDFNVKLTEVQWEAGISGPKEVIVKVTNPIEARDASIIDAQYKVYALLRDSGLPTPQAVLTKNGKQWTLQTVTDKLSLPVRVFHVLPGTKLENFEFTPEIVKEVGRALARVHSVLDAVENIQPVKGKRHMPFISPENVWCLRREADKLHYKQNLLNDDQYKLVTNTFNGLQGFIFDQRPRFEEGYIHSDFNETNLLLDEEGKISGILDFGDMHLSLRVFDVAAAILYLHLSDRLKQGIPTLARHLLEGYRSLRPFKATPQSIIVAMSARLAASLVYGLRTARLNYRGESTEYVLKTQVNGWEALKELTYLDGI